MTQALEAPGRDPLVAANAATELADRRKLRAVAAAAEKGRTQREIAAKLNVTQAAVYKMLVKARHTRDLFVETPREIALRYAAGEITRQQLLTKLADYPWTVTHVLDPDNPLPEQIVPGGWGQLELVVLDGFITDEDYDAVVARVTR